jgi:hypothetical protein
MKTPKISLYYVILAGLPCADQRTPQPYITHEFFGLTLLASLANGIIHTTLV